MDTISVIWPNRGRTNTVKVNPRYGPYNSLVAAKNAANSGDTIEVFPGTYVVAQDDQLLKDGVNWFFYPGAKVVKTNGNLDNGSGTCYGIFDDRLSGAVTSRVDGYGDFYMDFGASSNNQGTGVQNQGNLNAMGTVVVQNASSDVRIRCAKLRLRSYLSGVNTAAIFVKNCTVVMLDCDEVLDAAYNQTLDLGFNAFLGTNLVVASDAEGIYWESGEMYVNCKHVQTTLYAVYGQQITNTATNFWMSAELIENPNTSNCIYFNGDGTKTANWRSYITCKEVRGGVAYYTQGKHYLVVDKMSSTASHCLILNSAAGGTMEVWVTAQKITGTTQSFVAMAGAAGAQTLNLTCLQFEDIGAVTPGLSVTRGTLNVIGGGRLQVLNGVGCLVNNAAGAVNLGGLRIDTSPTNNAANLPVSVTAAGTVIVGPGAVLVASALADSIKGDAARTVKNYGFVTNKDKNANITLSPNAGYTVDVNVS